MNQRIVELAPCGVYCGACPSFDKTCKGCASEDRNQNRSSKWSCKIRTCCYDQKKLDYCIDCEKFPCTIIDKKLISSHTYDPRYKYRHEIPNIFSNLKMITVENYLEYQRQRWKCDSCGGRISFYNYTCEKCGLFQVVD